MSLPISAVPAAAYLFEFYRGVALDPHEQAEIDAAGLQGIDPEGLAVELQQGITTEPNNDLQGRAQAYWALGKKRDHALIPFFRDQLRLELGRDMTAAYQIMIALQDVGEETFDPNRSGYGMEENEWNRHDAERYLDAVAPIR